ncbi:MAG: hypothetical protein LC797_23130, partial [Chloroflexi bacterium]|nr:hypothetical protein [Chloroflexota bacterium]
MNDAQDAQPEHTRYMRVPWPVAAAGILGVLAVALAIGLFANRYVRPQVGVVPTPTAPAAAAAVPTASATPAPAATPAAGAPTAPTRLVPAADSPTVTPVVATAPSTQVFAVVTPSARPTLDPVVVAEVSAAYEQYWRVRTEALLELDKSHLSEIMEGDHL